MVKIEKILSVARDAFKSGITRSINFRKEQLCQLYRMCEENEDKLTNAIQQDLGKPHQEAVLFDVEFVLNDIRCMLHNINQWTKPRPCGKNFVTILDETFVQPEPYGVVLVLGAWNYPVQLALSPLVGAITAGNCAILKPSELAPRTASVLETLIPQYLDKDCFHVVSGGPQETTEILKEEFDYIFYTGSTGVGQLVREAANKHLTPVTLEMGGKSPVYFDDSVNMEVAVRRLLWGKFINAGQTCVAPDYLLCTKPVSEKLVPIIKKVLKEYYGDDPKTSLDFGRIVNEKHFRRLLSLMTKSGNVVVGGEHDESILYIAPTVLENVKTSDPVMQEEIFGPLLPIILVEGPDEAIELINSRDKPLTLNVYSKDPYIIRRFLEKTSSGSVCVNDSIVNLSVDALPFGGVGKSGLGAYHGKYSFETFSHQKAVLVRNYSALGEKLGMARYPPYSSENIRYMKKLLKKRPNILPPHLDYMCVFVSGFVFAFLLKFLLHLAGVELY